MPQIPHVKKRELITAAHQNALIDQVNANTEAIAALGGGDVTDIRELIQEAITEHVNDPEPHKAYDIDMPSLALIFQNGLV